MLAASRARPALALRLISTFVKHPGLAYWKALIPAPHPAPMLPDGHSGPHQFTTTNGVTYLWETDWECTCEECMSGESDYCSIYWRADQQRTQGDT